MDPIQAIGKLADNIRVLNVPRIEDLPYFTSAPVQFNYANAVNVAAGAYTFLGIPGPLAVLRPLVKGALYYIKNISLSANADEGDYMTGAVGALAPSFQLYLQSDAGTHFFREPILINRYYYQFDFKKFILNSQDNVMTASIGGVVNQTAALVGLDPLYISAVIDAVEIIDKNFIELFTKQPYPGAGYYGR